MANEIEEAIKAALEKARAELGITHLDFDVSRFSEKIQQAYDLALQGIPTKGYVIGSVREDTLVIEDIIFSDTEVPGAIGTFECKLENALPVASQGITCPQQSCKALNSPNASFCKECGNILKPQIEGGKMVFYRWIPTTIEEAKEILRKGMLAGGPYQIMKKLHGMNPEKYYGKDVEPFVAEYKQWLRGYLKNIGEPPLDPERREDLERFYSDVHAEAFIVKFQELYQYKGIKIGPWALLSLTFNPKFMWSTPEGAIRFIIKYPINEVAKNFVEARENKNTKIVLTPLGSEYEAVTIGFWIESEYIEGFEVFDKDKKIIHRHMKDMTATKSNVAKWEEFIHSSGVEELERYVRAHFMSVAQRGSEEVERYRIRPDLLEGFIDDVAREGYATLQKIYQEKEALYTACQALKFYLEVMAFRTLGLEEQEIEAGQRERYFERRLLES